MLMRIFAKSVRAEAKVQKLPLEHKPPFLIMTLIGAAKTVSILEPVCLFVCPENAKLLKYPF